MDKLTAIQYVLRNGHQSSEWDESGLLRLVGKISFSEETTFSKEFLDEEIELARD